MCLTPGANGRKPSWRGVDIGLGLPGAFPGEFAIGYDLYFDWFTQIGEMGSNVIRVYTPQAPAFYRAFYEYNRVASSPLYLMQGVYMDESDVLAYGDVFAEGSITIADMRQDIIDCVNMMHGNAVVGAKAGKASGVYQYDVSQYVIGWILGIECEAYLVNGTNEAHPEITDYEGAYIYTENASPFEVFIAQMMDLAVTYEAETYQMQRPVAFSNWVTTDPLTHPNEPRATEDLAVIDVEHIQGVGSFVPGFFASYHVYPYYPDFLNYPSGDPGSGRKHILRVYQVAGGVPLHAGADFGVRPANLPRRDAHQPLKRPQPGRQHRAAAGGRAGIHA